MNDRDRFEASIGEAYDRGVVDGRADAVPPKTEPMKWCEPHKSEWIWEHGETTYRKCRLSRTRNPLELEPCVLEDPVAHWVTEETT